MPAAASSTILSINFDNNQTGGFTGRGAANVATSTAQFRSSPRSLLVTGRTSDWHGAQLRLNNIVNAGVAYEFTAWVRLRTPASAQITMTVQVGPSSFSNLTTVSATNGGWVRLTGNRIFSAADLSGDVIIFFESRNNATAEYFLDDFTITAAATPEWDFSLPSLKDAYAGAFKIGNIMSPGSNFSQLNCPFRSADYFKHHYNSLTLENNMKPNYMMPTRNSTAGFAAADSVVNWAITNGIEVWGHTLVWHSQSPNWLNGGQGRAPLTRAEARANMELYINTVAKHYAGRVVAWDVINEAFSTSGEGFRNEPGGWKNALRSSPGHRAVLGIPVNDHTNQQLSPWYDAYANGANAALGECGSDYMYDAFVFTRLADPNAILYYNDFNEETPNKRNAIAQMVEELNAKWRTDPRNTQPNRLLIEGIGMQMHHYGGTATGGGTFNISLIEQALVRFAQTGAKVSITELDIPMGSWNAPHDGSMLNAALDARQANQYRQLFDVFMKHSASIDRVTFWGAADSVSWRRAGMPLLFDNNLQPKGAFYAVIEAAPNQTNPVVRHAVAFNAHSGTPAPASIQVRNGAQIGALPTPTRTGFTFAGWFTAATGGTQVTAATTITAATTLHARWTAVPVTHTVTFNLNNGTRTGGGQLTQTVTRGNAAVAPNVTRTGHTFAGWSRALTNITGNVTITARWTVNRYTVTFNVNGGSALSAANRTRTRDHNAQVGTLPTPTRSGHTFAGWFTTRTGGTRITTTTRITANTTYFARWIANPARPSAAKTTVNSRTEITISWNRVANATGYEVWRSTSLNGTYTLVRNVTSGSTLSWRNTGLVADRQYFYRVRAYTTVNGVRAFSPYTATINARTRR
jgi:uncharacterized repeat protein (TIGR02543 family)